MAQRYSAIARKLREVSRSFYPRGWTLGTSGNFSAVIGRQPFRMLITATGVDKGTLTPAQLVLVDAQGRVVQGRRRPSAETQVHLAVVRARRAGAVLHTHSVWSTILSNKYGDQGGLSVEGYEMLKGLEGVASHTQREWLPIIENSEDIAALSGTVVDTLKQFPAAHGFLLRRHGLYTWGNGLAQAKRHVEILEFLLEVVGRSQEMHERAAGRALARLESAAEN